MIAGIQGRQDKINRRLDPLLIALLKKIPPPDKGWPGPSRLRWFRTFAINVSQIYDREDVVEPVELEIDLAKPGAPT